MGNQFGFATEHFYSLMLASAILSMLLTPVSMSLVGRFYPQLDLMPALPFIQPRRVRTESAKPLPASRDRVLLAGYGRIGQNMAEALEEASLPVMVVDVDPERVAAARKAGHNGLHGDSSNPVVLRSAGIFDASVLTVTFPDPVAVINTVKTALDINPNLKVVARVHRVREAQALHGLSTVEMISPEYEASLEFVRRVLKASGWKPSEIRKEIPKIEENETFVEFAQDDEH
jgi:CPA2 family monovalent cation:H+ antiporter-2